MDVSHDPRIVMTLDAGGTSLEFAAVRGNKLLVGPICIPSEADQLDGCLANIVRGFTQVQAKCPKPPVAISFAFPGPADYPAGIIGDLPNLPGFRGGVALGPMLEDRFGIPTFINNDGNLFVYGEAIAGLLPYVNHLLEKAGNPKRFKNLFGITLGTGLGGGIVRNGEMLEGDNSASGEAWLLRNKLDPSQSAEEGASIRAVRRVYAEVAGLPFDEAPDPMTIYRIGLGQTKTSGNRAGRGGSLSASGRSGRRRDRPGPDADRRAGSNRRRHFGAAQLFLPALIDAMNDVYAKGDVNIQGGPLRRLVPYAFNIHDMAQRELFLKSQARTLVVPGSTRTVQYDPRLARRLVYRGWGQAMPWRSARIRLPSVSWIRGNSLNSRLSLRESSGERTHLAPRDAI